MLRLGRVAGYHRFPLKRLSLRIFGLLQPDSHLHQEPSQRCLLVALMGVVVRLAVADVAVGTMPSWGSGGLGPGGGRQVRDTKGAEPRHAQRQVWGGRKGLAQGPMAMRRNLPAFCLCWSSKTYAYCV